MWRKIKSHVVLVNCVPKHLYSWQPDARFFFYLASVLISSQQQRTLRTPDGAVSCHNSHIASLCRRSIRLFIFCGCLDALPLSHSWSSYREPEKPTSAALHTWTPPSGKTEAKKVTRRHPGGRAGKAVSRCMRLLNDCGTLYIDTVGRSLLGTKLGRHAFKTVTDV